MCCFLKVNIRLLFSMLQETSLKALDNEDKYTPDTNLKGWMYTIMRNIFINNYRKVVRDQTFIDQTDNLYHLNLPQDGVALGYVLGKHYEGKVKYLVNDLLMNLRGLAPLCIPINKTGKQAKDFQKMVEAGFQSDDQLIMFPAGLCSRRQNGVIRDLEWKKTFVVKVLWRFLKISSARYNIAMLNLIPNALQIFARL